MTGTGFVSSIVIYWVTEMLCVSNVHLLWNSCDVLLVGVMYQYEDHLKFHCWVSFVVLWVMFLLPYFKDM